LPDTGVVLSLLLSLNSLEFGLEIEGISHLIEKESEEEVTPIAIKSQESVGFDRINTVSE